MSFLAVPGTTATEECKSPRFINGTLETRRASAPCGGEESPPRGGHTAQGLLAVPVCTFLPTPVIQSPPCGGAEKSSTLLRARTGRCICTICTSQPLNISADGLSETGHRCSLALLCFFSLCCIQILFTC